MVKQSFNASTCLLFCLPCLLFFIPISSTLKSIFLVLSLANILFFYPQNVYNVFKNAWAQAILAFFCFVLLACCWSPGTLHEKTFVIFKWSKLLYLPILTVGFLNKKNRFYGFTAFLIAMTFTSILSLLIHYKILPMIIDPDSMFRNHIMTSMMMSFAAYLSFVFAFRNQAWPRIIYVGIGLITSMHVLFINEGRMGYLIYWLLMGLILIQMIPKKQAYVGLVLLLLTSMGVYYASSPMQQRVNFLIHEWQTFDQNKVTSIGYRIQFYQFASSLFQQHPLYGGGTGSFTHEFSVTKPIPSWVEDKSHTGQLLEPHSQYWFVAAEYGLVGLLGMIWLYVALLQASLRLSALRPIAMALLLIMVVGNTTDSLLFYSGSGYFFVVFFALCFGELGLSPQPHWGDKRTYAPST